jgi:hypothetical protein
MTIHHRPNAKNIIIERLRRRGNKALIEGAESAQANAPVDTGSYREDIQVDPMDGKLILKGSIHAGGGDYTGKIMDTGKEGKYVDYATDVEARDGIIESAMVVVIADFEGLL